MSTKASGNDGENESLEESSSKGRTDEESLDSSFAEQLDPVDHWWDDSIGEDKPRKANRRLDPLDDPRPERKRPTPVAKTSETEEAEDSEKGPGEETAPASASPERLKVPIVPLQRPEAREKEEEAEEDILPPKRPPKLPEVVETGKKKIEEVTAEESKPEEEDIVSAGDEEAEEESDGDSVEEVIPKPVVEKEEEEAEIEEEGEEVSPEDEESEISDEDELVEEGDDSEEEAEGAEETDSSDEEAAADEEAGEEEVAEPEEDDLEKDEGEEDSEEDEKEPEAKAEREGESGSDEPTAEAHPVVAPVKAKRGCWGVFTTLFFFATILFLLVLAGAGFYGWTKAGQLEEEIKSLVSRKAAEQGIFFDYEGWRYQFPRGLVLENITLYETEAKAKPKLRASDVGVNVDVVSLIRDRAASEAEISFDGSSLTLFQEGDSIGAIEQIDGEIFASQEALRIERLEATLGGLITRARGEVILPTADGEQEDAPEDAVTEGASMLPDFSPLQKILPLLAIESDRKPPVLDFQLNFDSAQPEAMELSARLTGQDFAWRGISFRSVSVIADFDPATKTVHFPTCQIGHGEGFIGGVLSLNTESKLLTIQQVQSTVDPIAFLSQYNAEFQEKLKDIQLLDTPTIQATGTVPLEDPSNGARLVIIYEHRRGFILSSEGRELTVSDLRGGLNFTGGALETNEFSARILGGDVAVNGITRLTTDGKPFSGLIEVSRISLAEIATYFGKPDLGLTGELFLDFRGVGYTELTKIRGGGKLEILNATLPSFPAIGPVQELLGSVIPAFGISGEGRVDGAYLIESGILITNDLTVRQSGAKIVTSGSVKLEQLMTDFTSTASLESTLATATGLGDKSIVVKGEGELMSPTLKLSEFPLDFAAGGLSEVLGTSPETLTRLQGLVSGEEGAAAKVFGAELEEATGLELGEEVNGLLEGLFGGGAGEGEEEEEEEGEAVRAAPISAEPVSDGEN